jgi:hypothetical protein
MPLNITSLCRSDLSFDVAQDPEFLEGPVAILSSRPLRDSYKNGETMNVNTIMRLFISPIPTILNTEHAPSPKRLWRVGD